MAEKKKEKKAKQPSRVAVFLRDERFHFAFGAILFFVSLYVLLALVSFFFTGGADQSIVLADGLSRADMKRQIVNWTVVDGAIIAHYLITESFGVSAFALVLIAFVVAIKLLGFDVKSLWKWILFPILFIVWAPLMLDFFLGGLLATSFVNVGGAYGAFLSDYLMTNIGIPGTFFVVLGAFLVFATFAFSATIPVIQNLFTPKTKFNKKEEAETESEVLNEVNESIEEVLDGVEIEETDNKEEELIVIETETMDVIEEEPENITEVLEVKSEEFDVITEEIVTEEVKDSAAK